MAKPAASAETAGSPRASTHPKSNDASRQTEPKATHPARVTQAQVAARAGVSRTVASFVLNGRTDQRVAARTAQRVKQAAEELGYRPNKIADILRTGESGTIALVSDLVTTTAAAHAMVRGVLEGARSHGMLLFTAETLGEPELEEQLITNLLDRRADGIVYATMFSREVSLPPSLTGERVVLLNCKDPSRTTTSILPDDHAAGADAGRLILKAGSEGHVVFLGRLPGNASATANWPNTRPLALQRRLSGLQGVLAAKGSLHAPELDAPLWDAPTGRTTMARLLRQDGPPTAVVCANDALALGVYQALAALGLRVPEDVAIVSFDGTQMGQWFIPPLTSFALPHEQMGRTAIDTLLGEDSLEAGELLVPMPLIAGGSIQVREPITL
ncbi:MULTISPECIES: LacI family DNA-binding transcriptional regulator [unclassified Actinomyces]|uniref:LacI family DNA-binding transcriptional regulator n=1 Tax=unclassified Actinomyces TaxID=2609248 RepID=UPI00131F0AAA|nr:MULTISPECIES: LacI family DNA-binding transcriptional regulator [unclassified Actinomyces]